MQTDNTAENDFNWFDPEGDFDKIKPAVGDLQPISEDQENLTELEPGNMPSKNSVNQSDELEN